MSYYCECDHDNMLDILDERLVKATRKAKHKNRKCSECSRAIKVGESYEFVFGLCGRDRQTFKTCSHCLALRNWVMAHIPCFCWTYTMMREDAINTAQAASHEAPGLLFGAWRREVAIRRARSVR